MQINHMQLCLKLKPTARKLFDEIRKNIGILAANVKRLYGSRKDYSKALLIAELREVNEYVRKISDSVYALINLIQEGKGLSEKTKK